MLNLAENYYVRFPEVYIPPVEFEVELLARLLMGWEKAVIVGYKGRCYRVYINMSMQYADQVVILEVGYPEDKFRDILQWPNIKMYVVDSARSLWKYIKAVDIEINEFFK